MKVEIDKRSDLDICKHHINSSHKHDKLKESIHFKITDLDSEYFYIVPKGFKVDGYSIPFFMDWILGKDTPVECSILHDFLCEKAQINKDIMSRFMADKVFYHHLVCCGCKRPKAFLMSLCCSLKGIYTHIKGVFS